MAYQLSKTGAQINTKLQELTVRTLTANGNIAATDGVVILDATSAECTLSIVDANIIVGQRLIIYAKAIDNNATIVAAASEDIKGCGLVNSTGLRAQIAGDCMEIVKVATNLYYITHNYGFQAL